MRRDSATQEQEAPRTPQGGKRGDLPGSADAVHPQDQPEGEAKKMSRTQFMALYIPALVIYLGCMWLLVMGSR